MNYTEIETDEDDNALQARIRVLEDLESVELEPTLPDEYIEDERVLTTLKQKYRDTMNHLVHLYSRIDTVTQKIAALKNSVKIFGDHGYVDAFSELIDRFEHDEGLDALKSEYRATLRTYRHLRRLMTHVIDEDTNKYMCFTCIEHTIGIAFAPCGHTCCLQCVERLGSRKCPYCRMDISQIIKLYLV